MPYYQRIFTIADVARVHKLFGEALRVARQVDIERRALGLPSATVATQRELRAAYLLFNDELDTLARATAAAADKSIRDRIKATQKRADTRMSPHLRDLIKSRALNPLGRGLATGAVGIADEDMLNRAVNPTSPQYGPFWRAQEFGTGSPEVKSQLGRVIRGYFFGGGLTDPEVPQSVYAGGGGPHPIFVSAASQQSIMGSVGFAGGGGARGGVGGFGTIQHEIEGRHFIGDGANAVLADWRVGIRDIETRTVQRLQAVIGTGLRRP